MKLRTILFGVGLGSALMYLFDKDAGNRRRALLRDKFIHTGKLAENAVEKAGRQARYAGGHLKGAVEETRHRMQEREVSDERLVERVRAAMGRGVSHPGAITVSANNGTVTVSGPILAKDVDNLLHTIEDVRGVKHVDNRLEVHETAGNIPSLQNG